MIHAQFAGSRSFSAHWWDPESAGGVGFGLVTALSSRPSLPVIFVFVYDKFGLCTAATMTLSVENIKLDEEKDLRMNFCCFRYVGSRIEFPELCGDV